MALLPEVGRVLKAGGPLPRIIIDESDDGPASVREAMDVGERNGHFYSGALAAVAPDLDAIMLAAHPDLFEPARAGQAQLRIRDGGVCIGSAVDAPFGCAPLLDVSGLRPLTQR